MTLSYEDDPYLGDSYEDNPTITGNNINTNCRYFEDPCCEDFDIGMPTMMNPAGVIYNTPPCQGDLECRDNPDYY